MDQCQCHAEPLTREDVLELSCSLLERGAEHLDGGRVSEATVMNALAQTAIALAERIAPSMPAGPIH